MAKASFSITVRDMPEVFAEILKHVADVLRHEGEAESDPIVARKLVSIACRIEAGQ